jgi:aconitate hydratase
MKFGIANSFNCIKELKVGGNLYYYFCINTAAERLGFNVNHLPMSLKVLFENLLRFEDGRSVHKEDIQALAAWLKARQSDSEIAFHPARVLMQDFTGVPGVVDLAVMRDAIKALGSSPDKINPQIPVDLVIDHSVQVDEYGTANAFKTNVELEVHNNKERYELLKWAQEAFDNFRVVPPGTGICHQVNLEYLAKVVWSRKQGSGNYVYPDTLVGTDSHTTMVNGLGVLGWGVGGIEAEAAMLGQPISMLIPEVVGFKLIGNLKEGVTATDLVLTATQMLRKKGVVGKFVEFYGPGLDVLSVADRSTISNMAPEYGATCGFFPVDDETLKYLRLTSRPQKDIELVEAYCKKQGLWRSSKNEAQYTDRLELDLSQVETSMAGPKRPQDRIILPEVKTNFKDNLPTLNKKAENIGKRFKVGKGKFDLGNGDVVIAAITSCTNTSNPYVMVAAGLLARNALKLGISAKPWVKTSLAPGSKVVTEYLEKSGLQKDLDKLGFNLVGYGCTTCIGNSGPLKSEIAEVIDEQQLVVASVLSGNRNFEGRIHPQVRANYLASPPLCVAYAIAGSINIDLATEPIATSKDGNLVYMRDIWPSNQEIHEVVDSVITSEMFAQKYSDVFKGDDSWQKIKVAKSINYAWDAKSTYIKQPNYFEGISKHLPKLKDIEGARILAVLGDSVTTDHISPAGSISSKSPAAKYLEAAGVNRKDFNSYGSRRGNHEVMMRGTFANTRIRNEILNDVEGGYTKYISPAGEVGGEPISIYDAAMKYKQDSVPLVIFAGKEYGSGSSRDWAAKGTSLLGVKAVIAESFERIHRSNLIGMGILPFMLPSDVTKASLGLDGTETVEINGIKSVAPEARLECIIKRDGEVIHELKLLCRIDTEVELKYFQNGGILHYVLRNMS